MTEAQKQIIIDKYNRRVSEAKKYETNDAVWNRCIGFELGYDSILDILGYFLVCDVKGNCIDIRPYTSNCFHNKEKEE